MKAEGARRHLVFAMVVALAGYVVIYKAVEHRRAAKGPWEITFTNTPSGNPLLIIDQPRLGISGVQIRFEEPFQATATNLGKHRFEEARPVPYDIPFGKCVFLDTTFLPGTVALEVLGHEIELLPRVLTIDLRECKWNSGMTITLPARQPPR